MQKIGKGHRYQLLFMVYLLSNKTRKYSINFVAFKVMKIHSNLKNNPKIILQKEDTPFT